MINPPASGGEAGGAPATGPTLGEDDEEATEGWSPTFACLYKINVEQPFLPMLDKWVYSLGTSCPGNLVGPITYIFYMIDVTPEQLTEANLDTSQGSFRKKEAFMASGTNGDGQYEEITGTRIIFVIKEETPTFWFFHPNSIADLDTALSNDVFVYSYALGDYTV
jgi:hypothetical protein